MCRRIFAGRTEVNFDSYMEFRNKLQEMLWQYEFYQMDIDDQDHITAHDFAKSLYIYYLPFNKIP